MNHSQGGTGATARTGTWRLWIVPIVWAAHFLAIYGVTALTCARKGTADWFLNVNAVPWIVGAATLVAAALLLIIIRQAMGDRRRAGAPAATGFVNWLSIAMAALVLLAVIWNAVPVLLVPICQ